MNFRFSDEDENFRSEFRQWLETNLPAEYRKTAFPIEFFANEEGEEWEKHDSPRTRKCMPPDGSRFNIPNSTGAGAPPSPNNIFMMRN